MPRPPIPTNGNVLAGVLHGRPAGYNAGCRCIACRAANAERQRRYRESKHKEREDDRSS